MKYQKAKTVLRQHEEAEQKYAEATRERMALEVERIAINSAPERMAQEAIAQDALAADCLKRAEELMARASEHTVNAVRLRNTSPPRFDDRLLQRARTLEQRAQVEIGRHSPFLASANAVVREVEIKDAAFKKTVSDMEAKIKAAVDGGTELPHGETVESYARKLVKSAKALPEAVKKNVVAGEIHV